VVWSTGCILSSLQSHFKFYVFQIITFRARDSTGSSIAFAVVHVLHCTSSGQGGSYGSTSLALAPAGISYMHLCTTSTRATSRLPPLAGVAAPMIWPHSRGTQHVLKQPREGYSFCLRNTLAIQSERSQRFLSTSSSKVAAFSSDYQNCILSQPRIVLRPASGFAHDASPLQNMHAGGAALHIHVSSHPPALLTVT